MDIFFNLLTFKGSFFHLISPITRMTTKGSEQWLETFPEFMTQIENKEEASNASMSLDRVSQRLG